MSSKKNKKKRFFSGQIQDSSRTRSTNPNRRQSFKYFQYGTGTSRLGTVSFPSILWSSRFNQSTRIPFFLALTNMFFTIGWYIRDIPKKKITRNPVLVLCAHCDRSSPQWRTNHGLSGSTKPFHQWRELLNLFFAQHWMNNKIISTNVQNNIPILPFLVMTPFVVGNHQKSLHISIAHQPFPYKTTTRVGLWPSGS